SNLMVSAEGILKILDFGIAKAVRASSITHSQVIMGTPNYMAPEQVLDSPNIDHRVDIFAVGAVFYELLTYEREFPGNVVEAIHRVLHSEPEPRLERFGALDPGIESIVRKALMKEPGRRYQDLGQMQLELSRIRERLASEAPRGYEGTSLGQIVQSGLASEESGTSMRRDISPVILGAGLQAEQHPVQGLHPKGQRATGRFTRVAVRTGLAAL